MAKEIGRLRGHPSRRAVGRDKQGFGRATPVRLLLSWKAYRMASPGRDSGGVGDRCALGKKRMPAGFTSLVENRIQTEDIFPEPSDVFWAKVRRVKKESYRGKPFGKDTVTCCDRPIVLEEGQEILTEERKELVAEREKRFLKILLSIWRKLILTG